MAKNKNIFQLFMIKEDLSIQSLLPGCSGLDLKTTLVQDEMKYIANCGQSYKASMIVIYDSRVVPDLKIPHITTLES